MNSLKHALTLAAAVAVLAMPAAASAAITPNPYRTTTGTGRMVLQSPFDTVTCAISNLAASASSTASGATGIVTGYTVPGCAGFVSGASFSTPMSFTIVNGAVTLDFSVLKRSVFGNCLYAGTFTGTMTNGSSTFVASGTKRLVRTLNGMCAATYPTQVSITLPAASITW